MAYLNDEMKPDMARSHHLRAGHVATPEARAAARRVTSALESCLAIPDRPELSYLRCFVRMAFEEASALGTPGLPSDDDLAYLERLQQETREYRSRTGGRPAAKPAKA